MRFSREFYERLEDGAMALGDNPQSGQYFIACALLEVADAINKVSGIGGGLDFAADTLGKGPLANGLRAIADAIETHKTNYDCE